MEVVLQQLKESNASTKKDKSLANLIISNLRRHSDIASTLPTLFDCAYKWKDAGMWRDLMERFEANVGVQSKDWLIPAFRIFKFNQIRQTYVIRQ
jgi:hypothetical protein